ncbi:hypothetical protein C8J57DRAFT_1213167 [Mycena rebaudengoi]|nr:hypothetical protein C8J57DRAFT_1213167 [Mycena rebaudengoi]
MGLSPSKPLTDPNQFSTPVTETATGFEPERKLWKTYAYIICGGGCVLSSRLNENPDISVLLVEAVKATSIQFILRTWLVTRSLFSPQAELDNRRVRCDRGKILGGISSINASIYQRYSPEKFSGWVKASATEWDAVEMASTSDELFVFWFDI